MMSHIDCWPTLASIVGLTPPPHGEWKDNEGKPIYFDSIDNSAYILGKAEHSARKSWIYVGGERFGAIRVDVAGDEKEPWVNIAWKYTWNAKDTWLGPEQSLGSIGSLYNLTMDPFEKYDMVFNGAMSSRMPKSSPGQYAGEDNGWGACVDLSRTHRVRSIDHQVPKHQAVPGRCIERPDAQPAKPGRSRACA